MDFSEKTPFPKDPFFQTRLKASRDLKDVGRPPRAENCREKCWVRETEIGEERRRFLGVNLEREFLKNPRVRKIRVRNSGAGNGCANFMDTWKKCVLSAGKNHVRKIPPFRGGGLGGGSTDFIFMGARIFLRIFRGT